MYLYAHVWFSCSSFCYKQSSRQHTYVSLDTHIKLGFYLRDCCVYDIRSICEAQICAITNLLCLIQTLIIVTTHLADAKKILEMYITPMLLSLYQSTSLSVSLSVCLFGCSLTPPKWRTPTSWNFEGWFPLGWRRF